MTTLVPKLQHLLLKHVPSHHLVEHNLLHLYGRGMKRIVQDITEHGHQPIPQWLLCLFFDTGNTSYFSFSHFIHKKAHRLPLNRYMHIGHQEDFRRKPDYTMEMFAVRVNHDQVYVLIYANPKEVKEGHLYPSRRVINPDLSLLQLEYAFAISSAYNPRAKMSTPYEDMF